MADEKDTLFSDNDSDQYKTYFPAQIQIFFTIFRID